MTQTAEIQAGPEMDTEIARAIGCVGVGTPAGTWWYLGKKTWNECPKFSTSIAAAWLVVEKMQELGWGHCSIDRCFWGNETSNDRDDWAWTVTFHSDEDPNNIKVLDSAETAPLAICRAALAALDADHG